MMNDKQKMEITWIQNLKALVEHGMFRDDPRWKKIFIEKLDETNAALQTDKQEQDAAGETEMAVAWTSRDQLADAKESGLGYLYAGEWKPESADIPLFVRAFSDDGPREAYTDKQQQESVTGKKLMETESIRILQEAIDGADADMAEDAESGERVDLLEYEIAIPFETAKAITPEIVEAAAKVVDRFIPLCVDGLIPGRSVKAEKQALLRDVARAIRALTTS